MIYNFYMLSKGTAKVANCILEGLLGEHRVPRYPSMNSCSMFCAKSSWLNSL